MRARLVERDIFERVPRFFSLRMPYERLTRRVWRAFEKILAELFFLQ